MNNVDQPQMNDNAAAEVDVGATTPPSSPRTPKTPQAPRKKRRRKKVSKSALHSVRNDLMGKFADKTDHSNTDPPSGNTNGEGSSSTK